MNMLLGYRSVAVDNRTHDLEHVSLQQRLDDHFISHAVRIAGGYCYNRFHFE